MSVHEGIPVINTVTTLKAIIPVHVTVDILSVRMDTLAMVNTQEVLHVFVLCILYVLNFTGYFVQQKLGDGYD